MRDTITTDRVHSDAWAVVLAGGDGTRLRNLTHKISGDRRPKQFCRIFGDRSLLGYTRERIRPLFRQDRTMFVLTKAHEQFYTEEFSKSERSALLVQPANRGTGVAIAASVFRILQYDWDAIVAFFPSDHYFRDDAAFAATVRSAVAEARTHQDYLILIGAEPRSPETEYGWIETGAPIGNFYRGPLLHVGRFWEKPPLTAAQELMNRGGLWNTFVTIGRARAFLDLMMSTVPMAVSHIANAFANRDLEQAYSGIQFDFSKDVLGHVARKLLVIPDRASGWTDLGSPHRVMDTLIENKIEPDWLRAMAVGSNNTWQPASIR